MASRKSRIGREALEQIALFEWASLNPRFGDFLFCIPNDAPRSRVQGALFKKKGLKPGVWDIFFAYPKQPYHGLWIEMKIYPNVLTDKQKIWGKRMRSLGFDTAICYSCDEAIHVIADYVNGARSELCLTF